MTDYIKNKTVPEEDLVLLIATLTVLYVLSTGDMNLRNILVSTSGEIYINDFEDNLGRSPGVATEKGIRSFFFNRDSRIFNEATYGLFGEALEIFERYISGADAKLKFVDIKLPSGKVISRLDDIPLFEERIKEARHLLKYYSDKEA